MSWAKELVIYIVTVGFKEKSDTHFPSVPLKQATETGLDKDLSKWKRMESTNCALNPSLPIKTQKCNLNGWALSIMGQRKANI